MSATLIRELFDGPIDIVGDVHGEIDALMILRRRLGYDERGRHSEGRRLVFVGDLGDRGPDSPTVVEWVRGLVEHGRAQCVMGNHDFNALLASHGGPMKPELSWLFDEAEPFQHRGRRIQQALVRGRRRDEIVAFFASLPVALERDGDLPVRVIHACWHEASIAQVRSEKDVIGRHRSERSRIQALLASDGVTDTLERKLLLQNTNPIKRLISGTEGRSTEPITINNEPRWEKRIAWWHEYEEGPLCVFGHYWRTALPNEGAEYHLFDGVKPNVLLGSGMCIDYSVGKRFKERLHHGFDGRFWTSLAALRLPEGVLYFDNAEPMPVVGVDGEPALRRRA